MKAKILMSSFLFIYFFERFAFTLISFLFFGHVENLLEC